MKRSIQQLVGVGLFLQACTAAQNPCSIILTYSDAGRPKHSGGSGARTDGGPDDGTGGTGNEVDSGDPDIAPPWVNVTGDLYDQAPPGKELLLIDVNPGTGEVIAGVNSSGLWASAEGGDTWRKLGTGAGSVPINNGPTTLLFDPEDPKTFWEAGIYGDNLFKTTDGGETIIRIGDIGHNDVVSIDFTDPERKTMLAGAHETRQKLFLSKDAGQTWTDIGANVPAEADFSSFPQLITSKIFLLGSSGNRTAGSGVYRSTDGGGSWVKKTDKQPWLRPLRTSTGAIYWPLFGGSGMIVSTDDGVTWKDTAEGPVQTYCGTPQELPDGRVLALGVDHVLATSNGGRTWKKVGAPLPYKGGACGIHGLAWSAKLKKIFLNHDDCTTKVIQDSVYAADFDPDTQ
jgi:photosystem II stability/assembly factor-like uncharacterized protein